jgi:hypothetical protein
MYWIFFIDYAFTWVYNSLILEVAWTLWTEVGDLQAHKNIKYLVGKK